MTDHAAVNAVTRELAERTGTDPADWFLVFKVRYGMEVVLRALAAVRGPGSVVTQVFTCSTAVDPILVAGLRPVYAEVAPASVALDPARLELRDDVRAVVLQHTFGIVDEPAARALADRAAGAGALLLEDAAHCAGRMARGADGEPLADVSFHSFGVEKMLPTKFGGAVWVSPRLRDTTLRERIVRDLAGLPVIGGRLGFATRTYRNQVRVLSRLPDAVADPLRSVLTRAGLFEPAVAPVEARARLAHAPMRPSDWVVDEIAAHLPGLAASEAHRSELVALYARELADHVEVPSAIGDGQPLVRFPFFASDRATAERILDALGASGVYAGRWYRPGLFPGVDDPAAYGWQPGTLPVTEDLMDRVVNLPTTVDVAQARRAVAVVLAVTAAVGPSGT